MNTIKDCFITILQGGKEESRAASRRVSKVLYGKHDKSIVSIRFPHRTSSYYGTLTKEQADSILYTPPCN